MSMLARILARLLWANMLWTMRRPWMKRLQTASLNLFRGERRERARESLIRQNRWARRTGLTLLTFSFNMLLASMILTGSYFLILNLYESGLLAPTEAMKH